MLLLLLLNKKKSYRNTMMFLNKTMWMTLAGTALILTAVSATPPQQEADQLKPLTAKQRAGRLWGMSLFRRTQVLNHLAKEQRDQWEKELLAARPVLQRFEAYERHLHRHVYTNKQHAKMKTQLGKLRTWSNGRLTRFFENLEAARPEIFEKSPNAHYKGRKTYKPAPKPYEFSELFDPKHIRAKQACKTTGTVPKPSGVPPPPSPKRSQFNTMAEFARALRLWKRVHANAEQIRHWKQHNPIYKREVARKDRLSLKRSWSASDLGNFNLDKREETPSTDSADAVNDRIVTNKKPRWWKKFSLGSKAAKAKEFFKSAASKTGSAAKKGAQKLFRKLWNCNDKPASSAQEMSNMSWVRPARRARG